MPKMNVLFDGNGSGLIRVVGVGDFIRFEAHNAALVASNADRDQMAAQKALDAAQVPPASPIRSDYFKAGVRCCAVALVEYAEKVRGGAV